MQYFIPRLVFFFSILKIATQQVEKTSFSLERRIFQHLSNFYFFLCLQQILNTEYYG